MKGQQTQHTPGPWEINEAITESGKRVTQICTRATGVSRWHIATVMRQGADTEGNARLIAAAPELLEALRGLVDLCACDSRFNQRSAMQNARVAIAKATQS